MTPAELEAARIRTEYERREREIGRDFYALTRPANLFVRHGQQRALLDALVRGNLLPLSERRILEVGCGRGQWFSVFEDLGARREHLAGIDLDGNRVEEARSRHVGADLREGDATALPWADATFDIVFQSTVFTSILDAAVKQRVANEMRRVLRSDGAIVWYDFRYDNPSNPNVKGVKREELTTLFPHCFVDAALVTLATPISRRLVPFSWLAASLLERLRLLNTHYLAVIRPFA